MGEQKKVLFVVYRVEWWGCFDSYCRQECKAEDTVCYVMPVPRYERDDGTFKANFDKKHFNPEKLEPMLPEGACMVNAEVFPMEEQGFERIYIHNPYDNGSLVDTVELKYYSSSLKRYTKELIYVSHFPNLIPDGYANCKVYEYVDTIYIPNGQARFSLDVKYDGKVKVMPSGIPEYLDRLAEQVEREPQGESRQQDSKMKLLYCVSFNDLYYGTEKQLRKMKDIFDYMRRNQDVLLIFRPDEDIRARRQQLDGAIWEGYEKLVADFRKNRIGILDESPDLYKAAVEADGIMCVSHPMEALFSLQGKYVLRVDWVQRLMPTVEDRCIPVIWNAAVEEADDKIEVWFVPEKTRLICKTTIPGGASAKASENVGRKKAKKHLSGPKVEIVAEVPDEVIGGLNYINITKVRDCLYLSPYQSDGIWKYELKSGRFSKRYLPDDGTVNIKITSTFSYGKYLYMIPGMYSAIVKYDTETEEIQMIDGWRTEFEKYVSAEHEKEAYFFWAVKQEGHMLYMASAKSDVWMEYDMSSDVWQLKPMKLPGRRFVDMVKVGERVWLLPLCGNEIILWNRETCESRVIYALAGLMEKDTPFSYMLDLGTFMAAFPQQETDCALLIQKSGSAEQEVAEVRNRVPCGGKAWLSEYQKLRRIGYSFVKLLDRGLIFAYEYYDGSFLILDKELRAVRKIPCRLPAETMRQQRDIVWKNAQYSNGFPGGLSDGVSLPDMIEFFARHGRENRDEIRKHYKRFY